jgi:cell division initiation protein
MLTPVDIDNVRFRNALLGYDKREVEQFLVQVSRAIEEYLTREREAQLRLAEALREMQRYRENEDLIKNSMLLAQRTADELIAAAKEKAAAAQHGAELEIRQMQQQLARLRGDREQFEYAFHGLLSGFIRQLENSNPGLAGKPAKAAVAELVGSTHELLVMAEDPATEEPQAQRPQVVSPAPLAFAPAASEPALTAETTRDEDADRFFAALETALPATSPGSAA